MLGQFYENLGVGVAEVAAEESSETTTTVVSLIFPKETPVYPDDLHHPENFDDVFLSLSGAKALLIDLKDAVNAAVSGQPLN